jgi:hypothetical protein
MAIEIVDLAIEIMDLAIEIVDLAIKVDTMRFQTIKQMLGGGAISIFL